MKRDESPVRAGNAPSCAACGSTREIALNAGNTEYLCVGDCKNPDNHTCGNTRKSRQYKLLKLTPIPKQITETCVIGLIDSLPKLCNEKNDEWKCSDPIYNWRGLWFVELNKDAQVDEWQQWLAKKQFLILDTYHTETERCYLLKDMQVDEPRVIFGDGPRRTYVSSAGRRCRSLGCHTRDCRGPTAQQPDRVVD